MASPNYSLRVIGARADARYSFARTTPSRSILRLVSTETESRITIHEVTMIPNDRFTPDRKAAGKIAGLAQAAKDKAAAVEEKTAAVIEDASQAVKDVAVKAGDAVVEAGKNILKLV